jgi:hypothetical protein
MLRHLAHGVTSQKTTFFIVTAVKTSNLTHQQKNVFLRSRAWPVHTADNLTTICEPLTRKCGILNSAQPYRPPLPGTGLALVCSVSARELRGVVFYK